MKIVKINSENADIFYLVFLASLKDFKDAHLQGRMERRHH